MLKTRLLTAAFLSIFSISALAETCTLTATLYGELTYFWYFGKDAFAGEGAITCRDIPVAHRDIRFISWDLPVGADKSKSIQLVIPDIDRNLILESNGFRTARFSTDLPYQAGTFLIELNGQIFRAIGQLGVGQITMVPRAGM